MKPLLSREFVRKLYDCFAFSPSQIPRGASLRTPKLLLYRKKAPHRVITTECLMESGDVLLSRAVASQVPSALRGLTSVFGMGTGGSLLL